MELKLNTNCQLFVEGVPTIKEGYTTIELIVSDSNPSDFMIETNRTTDKIVYDLPTDGLYNYYEILWPIHKPMIFVDAMITSLGMGNLQEDQEVEVTQDSIFSICKLRNCTLNLEKQSINDFVNGKSSCKKSGWREHDLLLVAVFVLENLICQQRFTEASMILEKVSSCTICENNSYKPCNC